MAFSGSILDFVASADRQQVLSAFATIKPHEWAQQQFQLRYRQLPPSRNESGTFAARVYAKLIAEHNTIRTWYTDDGRMSPLLMGQTTAKLRKPTLGDGISFDWDADLVISPQIIQFKGHLLAAEGMIGTLSERTPSAMAPLAKIIKAAHQARSEAHNWMHGAVSGGEFAERWVAHRTYAFLVVHGAEPDWSWGVSGCSEVFGPADWCGGSRVVGSGA